MGLALHNHLPTDLDLDGLTEHRHFPPGKAHRGPKAHISAHKIKSWSRRHETTQLIAAGHESAYRNRELRPHQLAALAALHRTKARDPVKHQTRARWVSADDDEGRDLAQSGVPLPGDGARTRPPPLERQGAFRDGSTVKRTAAARQGDGVDDAELYRMGLLYDDEHERGSGFSLGAIVRDETACYTVKVRPLRRKGRAGGREAVAMACDYPLMLLSEDDAWSEYLMTPDVEEVCDDPRSAWLGCLYECDPAQPLDDTTTPNPPDLIADDVSECEDAEWFVLRRVPYHNDNTEDAVERVSTYTRGDDSGRESPTADPWIVLG